MFTKTTMAAIVLAVLVGSGTAVHAAKPEINGAGCVGNCGKGSKGDVTSTTTNNTTNQGGAGGNAYAGAIGLGVGKGGNATIQRGAVKVDNTNKQGQLQGQALFNKNDLSNRNNNANIGVNKNLNANLNANKNTNRNNNKNVAKGGDANQGQLQGQGQKQGQGQDQGQKQSQKTDQANAQENTMIVEDSGQMHYSGSYDVKTVGVAVAPDIQATAGCRKPLSAGAGWMGGAFSFGTTFLDESCVQFENIRFGLTSDDAQTRALTNEVLQLRLAADLNEALEKQAKKEGKDAKSTAVIYSSTTETADNDDGWSNYQNMVSGG